MQAYIILAYKTIITLYLILLVAGFLDPIIKGSNEVKFTDLDGEVVVLTPLQKIKLITFNPTIIGTMIGCTFNNFLFEYEEEE